MSLISEDSKESTTQPETCRRAPSQRGKSRGVGERQTVGSTENQRGKRKKRDNWLAIGLQLQLFFTLFASLALQSGITEEDNYNVGAFDAMMVTLQLIAPSIGAVTNLLLAKKSATKLKERVTDVVSNVLANRRGEGEEIEHQYPADGIPPPPSESGHAARSSLEGSVVIEMKDIKERGKLEPHTMMDRKKSAEKRENEYPKEGLPPPLPEATLGKIYEDVPGIGRFEGSNPTARNLPQSAKKE